MTNKIFTLICLIFLIAVPVFSQEDEPADDDYAGIAAFTRGEQLFSLNAGAIFPLFTLAPFHEDDEPLVGTLSSTHTGVSGSLKLGFFVRDNLMLGGELAGMYAATDNSSLTMIPITFVTQYYFLKYPFEFPIYINVGVSMNSFDDYFRITPLIKPGAGAYYNINGEWALGLNFDYWFMPELYFNTYKNETRIANFLQISLSGVYHF